MQNSGYVNLTCVFYTSVDDNFFCGHGETHFDTKSARLKRTSRFQSRKCDFFGELPKIQHAFYEIYLPFDRGFLKISAVKEKCRTAHGMYQIRNNIRYKTGKRRKFAKFIEMNMQEYTILRYKKICSMFLPLQNFCKLHRAPQKSSVKKANNRFQKYQMSCYVN